MKNGKKPTRKQKFAIEALKLAVSDWLVVKDTPDEFHIVKKGTDELMIIKDGQMISA